MTLERLFVATLSLIAHSTIGQWSGELQSGQSDVGVNSRKFNVELIWYGHIECACAQRPPHQPGYFGPQLEVMIETQAT